MTTLHPLRFKSPSLFARLSKELLAEPVDWPCHRATANCLATLAQSAAAQEDLTAAAGIGTGFTTEDTEDTEGMGEGALSSMCCAGLNSAASPEGRVGW